MADNENLNTEAVEPVEVVHDLPVERSLLGATLGATATEEQEPDEEYSTIPVQELLEVKLGRQGENDTQTVVIDCSAWLTQLPGCQLLIAATRPGEREIYLPEVSVSSGVVTWPILEQDTACAGTGRAEVRAMKDGKVKKSALFRTRIEPALEPGGSPDAPTPPNWVRLIIESVEASQAAAEHAEELVDEATACAINAVRFDENQSLTDAQKATGRGNIGAVAVTQGIANAGKTLVVGTDGNVALDYAGISDDAITALLELLKHVAYMDASAWDNYAALYEALTGSTPEHGGDDPEPEPIDPTTIVPNVLKTYSMSFRGDSDGDEWRPAGIAAAGNGRIILVGSTGEHALVNTDGGSALAYPIPIPAGTQTVSITNLDETLAIGWAVMRYTSDNGWIRQGNNQFTVTTMDRTKDVSSYADGTYYLCFILGKFKQYADTEWGRVADWYGANEANITNIDMSACRLIFE